MIVIGILVNGSVVTIGTMAELRKKYEDYSIVINRVTEGCENEVEKVIKMLIPKAMLDLNPEEKGIVYRVRNY